MLYHIWVNLEHRITIDDENAETDGYSVSLRNGIIVTNDGEDYDDEDAEGEDNAQERKASATETDVFMTEIQDMLERQRNAD